MNSRPTKKDVIVAELRRRIEIGEISRGARMFQNALATEFATSSTPVREALRELEAEGLLLGEPRRGVRVASADLEDCKGVYMVRRLVEPFAMQRAALRVSRRDLLEASRLINAMAAAQEKEEYAAITMLNRDFHFLFYRVSGPRRFVSEIQRLWLSVPWDILEVLTWRVAASIREHRIMVEAIEQNDIERLTAATEEHIRHSHLALARHLSGVGDGSEGGAATLDPFVEGC